MSYIWLTSSTVAQTGAFGQIDIFTTKKFVVTEQLVIQKRKLAQS